MISGSATFGHLFDVQASPESTRPRSNSLDRQRTHHQHHHHHHHKHRARVRAVVVTVSDRLKSGTAPYEDKSGDLAAALLAKRYKVERRLVADEQDEIRGVLLDLCENLPAAEFDAQVVITTGGTGFAPRDVTPEATLSVITRQAPAISTVLAVSGMSQTPFSMLSRGVAGIHLSTFIVNLPGSSRAVQQGMSIILPILPHALEQLANLPPTKHDA